MKIDIYALLRINRWKYRVWGLMVLDENFTDFEIFLLPLLNDILVIFKYYYIVVQVLVQ